RDRALAPDLLREGGASLASFGRIRPRPRVLQDEAAQAVGVAPRHREGRVAAHGAAADDRAFDPQMVEEAGRGRGDPLHREEPVARGGAAEAARVEADGLVAVPHGRDLGLPHEEAERKGVEEEHGRSLSLGRVRDLVSRDLRLHGLPPTDRKNSKRGRPRVESRSRRFRGGDHAMAEERTSPPVILVANDDGHAAPGIQALAEAMEPLGEVWVVAPESEQSAASHAISLHRPLRIREVKRRWYAVDGTPTDCSYVGINHVLRERRPAIMVSGINHGPNMADDVTYSGTVAAAMEASLLGVPAIAFSLVSRHCFVFDPAARFARSLVAAALEHPLPPNLLLNVNVPAGAGPTSYAVT